MWTIKHTVTFANRTGTDRALGRIQSDLSEMAHTKFEVYSDQLLYSIGGARWWMGGKPLDMTDGGTFVVDHANCHLAASVSLKCTFLSCLAMSLAFSAFAVLVYDATPARAGVYGLLAFGWLWGVNYYRTRRAVAKYLGSIARAA
jgi:hypothetical protein